MINLQKLVIKGALEAHLIIEESFECDKYKTENRLNFFLIFIDAQISSCHSVLVIDQFSYGLQDYSIANKDFTGLSFIRRFF